MQEVWQDVLRCVSRWELLQTIHSGGPSDAVIFAGPPSDSPTASKKRTFFSLRPSTHKEHGKPRSSTIEISPVLFCNTSEAEPVLGRAFGVCWPLL